MVNVGYQGIQNLIFTTYDGHTQDSKANPYNRFSASVNLGSSNYFRES